MPKISHNIAANIVGKGTTVGLALLTVPWYVRLLGVESYGLIGFFASLQAIFSLLNMGFSTTVNREIAHLSAVPNSAGQQRTLVRSVEAVYWGLAVCISLIVVMSSQWIARHWLISVTLDETTLRTALVLMGLVIALQFPFYLYQGVLFGLERQVSLNVIIGVAAILRFGGALAVLYWVAPSITLFFAWNAGIAALQTLVTWCYAWNCLPKADRPTHFEFQALKRMAGFSVEVMGITFTGAIIVQLDKIVLSRSLNLDQFGYYALAGVIASSMIVVSQTIFNAIFPRFSYMRSAGLEGDLTRLYHRTSQLMSLLVLPAAAVLTVMSYDVLLLWTGDAEIAEHTWLFVSLLVMGSTLSALYNVPLALQLAFRQARASMVGLLAGVVVLTPLMFILAPRYGGAGVASLVLAFYALYTLICVNVMHRHLLPAERWRWLRVDVGIPAIAAFSTVAAASRLRPMQLNTPETALWLASAWLAASILLVLLMPYVREQLFSRGKRLLALFHGRYETRSNI